MERYEIVKDYIYLKYSKIYDENIRIRALSHTAMVDSTITLLASFKKIDMELAKIAALFHDYAQFIDNCPHLTHAKLSSIHAYHYLKESGLFQKEEIDEICYAISKHSDKASLDNPFCELLKNADALANFLENPHYKFKDEIKTRIDKIFIDINI